MPRRRCRQSSWPGRCGRPGKAPASRRSGRADVGIEVLRRDPVVGGESLAAVGAGRAVNVQVVVGRVAAGVVPDDRDVALGIHAHLGHSDAGDDLAGQLLGGCRSPGKRPPSASLRAEKVRRPAAGQATHLMVDRVGAHGECGAPGLAEIAGAGEVDLQPDGGRGGEDQAAG